MALPAPVPENKMYSIAEGKFIDVQPQGTGTETVEKEEETKPDPDEEETEEGDGKETPEKKEESTEGKDDDDEEPEAKKEEPKKDEKKKEEPKKEAKTDDSKAPDVSEYLSKKYEKYDIKNEEDLDFILENTQELANEVEDLRSKLKEGKPAFASKKQEAVAKFLDAWPEDKLGEGMAAVASIIQMDIPNIADKKAMEEVFIMEHTDLTRDEAKELFEDEYAEKYNLNKDDFDDDAAYEKKKRLLDIKIKNKVAEDKRKLLSKQEELKSLKEKPSEKKAPEEPQVPEKSLSEYTKQIDSYFDGKGGKSFNGFVFKDDDNPDLSYKITFDEEKLKELREHAKNFIKAPAQYDKSGKIPNFDPANLTRSLAKFIYSDWYDEQHFKGAQAMARVMKAEQIAGKKPDKESKSQGKTSGMSIIDQFREQARIAEEKRKQGRK